MANKTDIDTSKDSRKKSINHVKYWNKRAKMYWSNFERTYFTASIITLLFIYSGWPDCHKGASCTLDYEYMELMSKRIDIVNDDKKYDFITELYFSNGVKHCNDTLPLNIPNYNQYIIGNQYVIYYENDICTISRPYYAFPIAESFYPAIIIIIMFTLSMNCFVFYLKAVRQRNYYFEEKRKESLNAKV